MFEFLGRAVFRYRWLIIVTWLAGVGASLLFAPKLSGVLKAGGFQDEDSESAKASRLLQHELNTSSSSLIIVFFSDNLKATDPRFISEMNQALSDVVTMAEVDKVISYVNTGDPRLVSADGSTTYVVVGLSIPTDEAMTIFPEIRQRLKPTQLEAKITGSVATYAEMFSLMEEDLRRAEMVTFPLALIALILVFRTLVAAAAPLMIGGVAISITFAILYFLGQRTDMSIFVMNMSSMLGLGIAIDYALFIVSRFREEIQEKSVATSVVNTVATAGRAVFFSGGTVFVGLMGLGLFKLSMLRSIGVGGATVVIMSVLAAITFLPAVLAVLGHRVNSLRVLPGQPGTGRGFWHWLSLGVMRRPWMVLIPVLALLLVLGTPIFRATLGAADITMLPMRVESRQGYERLREQFGPGEISPITVVVQADDGATSPEAVGFLYDFTRQLEKTEGIVKVQSIVNLVPGLTKEQYQAILSNPDILSSPSMMAMMGGLGLPLSGLPLDPQAFKKAMSAFGTGKVTTIQAVTRYQPELQSAQEVVRLIRGMPSPPGIRFSVTGISATLLDIIKTLYVDFPRAIFAVILVIYVALVITFGSLVIPLKAVIMNSLSLVASYGALVFVFQEGNFSNILGFTPQGFVEVTVPILLFSILFGLSMDYEVFILSRIKEVYDKTGDNTQSVALGLERTGGIVTSAAAILIIVAGSFSLGDIVIVKAIGVGIALAILLDATVIRALLVPATMRLLGDWNWWAPGFLKRVLPRTGPQGH